MERQKLTVIVLDDDRTDIEIFSRQLSHIHDWDIELQTFYDWPSAEQALQKPELHVLFVDQFMGAINGLDVIREIRRGGDRSPVVLLTGAGHETLAIEAIRTGADDYLNKNSLNEEALRRSLTISIWQARLRNEKANVEADLVSSRTQYLKIVEELEKANAQLNQIRTEDFLTGLSNRRHFETALNVEIRRSQNNNEILSVLWCNIDLFKEFNDQYGHHSGDFCLQEIAKLLKATFIHSGQISARYGGDEFTVILPNTPETEAFTLAEDFRQAFAKRRIPHNRTDEIPYATVSIGLFSVNVKTGIDTQWIISQAGKALLVSKKSGRNRTTIGRM